MAFPTKTDIGQAIPPGGGSSAKSILSGAGAALGGPWGLAAAGASMLGSYFSGRAAKNERKHVEQRMLDMDNTKHQREVRDLRKAGLNPILSATQGAASPGQVAPAAPVPDYGGSVTRGLSSGLQAAMLKANIDNVHADTAAKMASALLTGRTADNLPSSGMAWDRYSKETKEVQQRIWKLDADIAQGTIGAERARLEFEWMKANKDKILAMMAPTAYEREQIDKMFKGDMSPSTAIKLFLEFWKGR